MCCVVRNSQSSRKIIVRRFFLIVRVVIIVDGRRDYSATGHASNQTRCTKKPIVSRPDTLLCKHTMRLNGRQRERERERKACFCEPRTNEFTNIRDSTNATRVCLTAAVGNRILCYEFDWKRREGKGKKLKKKSCKNEFESSAHEYNKKYKTICFLSANTHYEYRVFSAKRPTVLLFSLVLGRLSALFSRLKFFFIMKTKCTRDKNILAVQ